MKTPAVAGTFGSEQVEIGANKKPGIAPGFYASLRQSRPQ
jgi:hypothetical protein